MRRKFLLAGLVLAISLIWVGANAQPGNSGQWRGPVNGTVVQMPTGGGQAPFLERGEEVPLMYGPGGKEALLEAIAKAETPEGKELLLKFLPQQNTIDAAPPSPGMTANFTGPSWGGIWTPGDPVIAAGENHVGVMINSQCDFYTKAGVWSGGSILKTFFAPVFDTLTYRDPFDVKIIFDHHNNRWVMLALTYRAAPTAQSRYLVAVSQTINPLGLWWIWALNSTDPLEPAPFKWADYPGLGFDADTGVYVTSNQYTLANAFIYAKIRALRKGALYSGTAIWWDYWGMIDPDGATTFTIKPAHTFGNPGVEYLVNTKSNGGNLVHLWSLVPGGPLASLGSVVIGWYWPPPTANCTVDGLNLFDCRTQDAQYRDEHLYTSFHEEYWWEGATQIRSAARFLKLNIPTMTAAIDERYGHPDYHYFFPSIYSSALNNIVAVFNRCGGTEMPEFISARYSTRLLTQGDVKSRGSLYLQAGAGPYDDWVTPNRWGDYSGIAYDPFTYCTMWIYSMYATAAAPPANWSTWIGSVFTHPEAPQESLYWKPPYEDYAPHGMPDFDQKQDEWGKEIGTEWKWTFCGPVAVANCFWWFDSKYNIPAGVPGDGNDQFPLVRDYMDNNPPFIAPLWDDHDPWNVDHVNTPWGPPIGLPPPPTPQPFVPGLQPQPSGMPSWGELVERLAWYFDTDGIQSGYCLFSGTNVLSMQAGINQWLQSETLSVGGTLADRLYLRVLKKPSFAQVETLLEVCEDVILLLGFWWTYDGINWYRNGGHYVTLAGVNSESLLVGFSDPYFDNAEAPPQGQAGKGKVGNGTILPHPNPHSAITHNDAGNISHDIYGPITLESPSPGGIWAIHNYPPTYDSASFVQFMKMFQGQNIPPEYVNQTAPYQWPFPSATEVEYAIVISPKVQPNHFKTWRIQPQTFDSTVFVQDQFMEDNIRLIRLEFLSNPVKKVVQNDTFDITRPNDHLTWYRALGRDTLIQVEYVNQFESTTVTIDSVKYLLVPTQKLPHTPPESLDHYKAYRIKDPVPFDGMPVLEDQFDSLYGEPEFIDSLKPIYFLTPALKNMPPPMFDSITHYVAYEIFPKRFFPKPVNTFDQFGSHVLQVDTSKILLVPTKKLRVTPLCNPPNIGCPNDETQDSNGTYTTTTKWTANDGNPADPTINITSVTICGSLPPGITSAVVNVDPPGLPAKTATGTVTYTVGNHCQSGGAICLKVTNNCTPPKSDSCTFNVLLTNGPPVITCPPNATFSYFVGYSGQAIATDPDGDAVTFSKVAGPAGLNVAPNGVITWATTCADVGGPYTVTVRATDVCGATDDCSFQLTVTNSPPIITQPDTISGFVGYQLTYTIGGTDPDLDLLQDQASITIIPSCGTYSITRITGHGTSSGTWQVVWQTTGCSPDTYLVIHDLTDACGVTSYCTTTVFLYQEVGWYWKPPYEDYAPNGIPDIDQKQDNWRKVETGQFSFCGPVAVANCFKWFDSKYNVPPGAPCDGIDMFPLVRDYTDNLPPIWCPMPWDDHSPENVDHPATPWAPPNVPPPPPTPQPFVPGPQPPGQMQPWGELVERLAWYFNTDGIQTGYCQFSGTNVTQMQQGIDMWLQSEHFPNGSTLADTLCEVTLKAPTFAKVESLVEKSENVILLLGFWYYAGGPGEQQFIRGDVNENGIVEMGDLAQCYNGPPFSCDDAADVNDDGVWNPLDCDYLSNFLMGIGPPPPPPFPDCGIDPTPDGLGCADFPPCPGGPGQWYRCGGHYVTVAGVNSQELQIAFSDPFFDNAELGNPGRVLNGMIIPHTPGHDATAHNDEGNVSHDIYHVIEPSPSPGGLWSLPDYPVSITPGYCMDFSLQNIPDEFMSVSMPWNGISPIFTEVEYAVHISPWAWVWDYRGDVNNDGNVNSADVAFLINYLFVYGPAPSPLSEGDVNCDGSVNSADVSFLINYLFVYGPEPKCKVRVCDP